jgi:hypothetical protein
MTAAIVHHSVAPNTLGYDFMINWDGTLSSTNPEHVNCSRCLANGTPCGEAFAFGWSTTPPPEPTSPARSHRPDRRRGAASKCSPRVSALSWVGLWVAGAVAWSGCVVAAVWICGVVH